MANYYINVICSGSVKGNFRSSYEWLTNTALNGGNSKYYNNFGFPNNAGASCYVRVLNLGILDTTNYSHPIYATSTYISNNYTNKFNITYANGSFRDEYLNCYGNRKITIAATLKEVTYYYLYVTTNDYINVTFNSSSWTSKNTLTYNSSRNYNNFTSSSSYLNIVNFGFPNSNYGHPVYVLIGSTNTLITYANGTFLTGWNYYTTNNRSLTFKPSRISINYWINIEAGTNCKIGAYSNANSTGVTINGDNTSYYYHNFNNIPGNGYVYINNVSYIGGYALNGTYYNDGSTTYLLIYNNGTWVNHYIYTKSGNRFITIYGSDTPNYYYEVKLNASVYVGINTNYNITIVNLNGANTSNSKNFNSFKGNGYIYINHAGITNSSIYRYPIKYTSSGNGSTTTGTIIYLNGSWAVDKFYTNNINHTFNIYATEYLYYYIHAYLNNQLANNANISSVSPSSNSLHREWLNVTYSCTYDTNNYLFAGWRYVNNNTLYTSEQNFNYNVTGNLNIYPRAYKKYFYTLATIASNSSNYITAVTPTYNIYNDIYNIVLFTATIAEHNHFVKWIHTNNNALYSVSLNFNINLMSNLWLSAVAVPDAYNVGAYIHTNSESMISVVTPKEATHNYGYLASFTATLNSGAIFNGWYYAKPTIKTKTQNFTKTTTSSLILYATAYYENYRYKAEIAADHEAHISAVTPNEYLNAAYGSEVQFSATINAGHLFLYWKYSNGHTASNNIIYTRNLNENLIMYAYGANNIYNFTLSFNNTTFNNLTGTSNANYSYTFTIPINYKKDDYNDRSYHYKFLGWNNTSITGTAVDVIPGNNITISTADWKVLNITHIMYPVFTKSPIINLFSWANTVATGYNFSSAITLAKWKNLFNTINEVQQHYGRTVVNYNSHPNSTTVTATEFNYMINQISALPGAEYLANALGNNMLYTRPYKGMPAYANYFEGNNYSLKNSINKVINSIT